MKTLLCTLALLLTTNAYAKSPLPPAKFRYECGHAKNSDVYTLYVNFDGSIGYAFIDEDKGKLLGGVLDPDGNGSEDSVRFANRNNRNAIEVEATLLEGATKGKIRVEGSEDLERGVYSCSKQ